MRTHNQRLINIGVTNYYQHAILLIVTGSGLLYTTNTLPAYDPSVLMVPRMLIYPLYLALVVGGLTVYAGFISAFWDKVLSLNVQFIGLLIQTLAILGVAISVVAFAGFTLSIFMLLFSIPIGSMHAMRLKDIYREIKNAPAKIAVATKSEDASTSGIDTRGDLVLQTLQFQQVRIEKLELELGKMP